MEFLIGTGLPIAQEDRASLLLKACEKIETWVTSAGDVRRFHDEHVADAAKRALMSMPEHHDE